MPEEATATVRLRDLPQWICWKYEERAGKPTKVPRNPLTREMASSSDPATWATYEEARERFKAGGYDGIGFVFGADDPFCGIDLDKCVQDGEIAPWAQEIVDELDSYTELSPSGTGLHIIVRAELPSGGNRKGSIEMYDRGRFFTITSRKVGRAGVEERQEQVNALHARLFPQRAEKPLPANRGDHAFTDEEIIRRASEAKNGPLFTQLWAGDASGYESASEADQALANLLAFWAGPDGARIESLFARSGLNRDKWRKRPDYRRRTIERALSDMHEYYTPGRNGKHDVSGSGDPPPTQAPLPKAPWPVLDDAALFGLPGEIVRAMEPHTEADPAALLVNLLSAFGNAIGRASFFRVGADKHHLKINAALVGETSKGRKGMSWGFVANLMGAVDDFWADNRVQNGLSSGEGLIYAVRDPVYGEDKNGDPVALDLGAEDKRLFVMEGEFAGVLSVAQRQASTLSATIRSAWDSGKLAQLTKNSPQKATHAHISIVGHITMQELRRLLSDTDAQNGFANRFLWVMVKRSKVLPFGGEWHTVDVAPFVRQLSAAHQFAKHAGELAWGESGRELWAQEYEALSEGAAGLFGAVTSRAEALVLRLACVYVLIDNSRTIEAPYLEAALALWRYCEDSARYIFGNATGDAVADRIEEELRAVAEEGLRRNEIRDLFSRNQSAERITLALDTLERLGRVRREKQSTGGRGRPGERWFITAYPYAENAENAENDLNAQKAADRGYAENAENAENTDEEELSRLSRLSRTEGPENAEDELTRKPRLSRKGTEESQQQDVTCIHGFSGGKGCALCDPEHPFQKEKGATEWE